MAIAKNMDWRIPGRFLDQSKEIDRLRKENKKLRDALHRITECAEVCSSWESFPSGPIEQAHEALGDD